MDRLSPGVFWKRLPKEPLALLRWRERTLVEAAKSAKAQRSLIAACKEDLLFFVNSFGWIYEPRSRATLPWITYPFQDVAFKTILECIEQGEDLVMEKSRDMGASWMSLTVMYWMYVFHPGCKFLMISRNEKLVDQAGEPDSLFWKVKFLRDHLPKWMRPDESYRKLNFENLGNGSTITGTATTSEAGVGGRATAIFVDEFSRIKDGFDLLGGTADTSRCRIFNFTHWGTDNAAYHLSKRLDVRKLRLPWWEHPLKNKGLYKWDLGKGCRQYVGGSKWRDFPENYAFIDDGKLRSLTYDKEDRRRCNSREMAQNWDMDPQGGAFQFFERTQIDELKAFCRPPYHEGTLLFDESCRPKEFLNQPGGAVRLWCNLDSLGQPPKSLYAAGTDVSWGTGATNTCASFWDMLTGEKVAEVVTPNMAPDQFAKLLVAACWLFRGTDGAGAFLGWEMQGPGLPMGKKVVELGYTNVYYRQTDVIGRLGKVSELPGWVPTQDAKRLLLEEYRAALYDKRAINRSAEALDECLYIIHTPTGALEHSGASSGDDPTGARANHGDRVVADFIAWWLCRERKPQRIAVAQESTRGSLAWRRELRSSRAKEQEAWAE